MCIRDRSNTGLKEAPALSDFQIPPLADPTYNTSGLRDTPSIVLTRPLIVAGPIDRARRSPKEISDVESCAVREEAIVTMTNIKIVYRMKQVDKRLKKNNRKVLSTWLCMNSFLC